MEAIKYRWSGDHKTVLDIGNNDVIVRISIEAGIAAYKKSFKILCKKYYIEKERDFVTKDCIDDTKKVIRALKSICEALNKPKETVDQIGARTMVSQLF